MRAIDKLCTKHPFSGNRQISSWLAREGIKAGRHRVRRLMPRPSLQAVSRRPRRASRTRSSDLPVSAQRAGDHAAKQGLVFGHHPHTGQPGDLSLVAIIDWTTRKTLSWRVSNTMHADFCVDALQEAVRTHGPPEIMNTDQAGPSTGAGRITTLPEAGVRVTTGGRGRCMDNIFIERLQRSRRSETVCLQDIADGFAGQRIIPGPWQGDPRRDMRRGNRTEESGMINNRGQTSAGPESCSDKPSDLTLSAAYFFGFHSAASFSASAIWAGVM